MIRWCFLQIEWECVLAMDSTDLNARRVITLTHFHIPILNLAVQHAAVKQQKGRVYFLPTRIRKSLPSEFIQEMDHINLQMFEKIVKEMYGGVVLRVVMSGWRHQEVVKEGMGSCAPTAEKYRVQ